MTKLPLALIVTLMLTACGSDDHEEAAPPPPVTAFENWNDDSNNAAEVVADLAILSEESERSGDVPTFFTGASLMSRDERDNVQNGYVYPLYFATRNQDFPSRQWSDGYTVQKSNPSDSTEERKVREIREDLFAYYSHQTIDSLFYGLNQFGLIDVRHYSFKIAAPNIAETCFTVRYDNGRSGTINYCYEGHRFLRNDDGSFPKVRYDHQTGSSDGGFLRFNMNSRGNIDSTGAFQLFVLSIAAYEVMFDNPDNQDLRDHFITYDRLSVQMHSANDAYGGIFDNVVENQSYLDGRQ